MSNLNKATNYPYCKESRGELRIETYLEKVGSSFIKEKRFSKCRYKHPLPFDFYLPKENIAIEYDGEGHYMPVPFHMSKEKANINEVKLENHLQSIQFRDQIKTDFCLQNGIKLIRIPYWNFDNIEQILDKHLNRIA